VYLTLSKLLYSDSRIKEFESALNSIDLSVETVTYSDIVKGNCNYDHVLKRINKFLEYQRERLPSDSESLVFEFLGGQLKATLIAVKGNTDEAFRVVYDLLDQARIHESDIVEVTLVTCLQQLWFDWFASIRNWENTQFALETLKKYTDRNQGERPKLVEAFFDPFRLLEIIVGKRSFGFGNEKQEKELRILNKKLFLSIQKLQKDFDIQGFGLESAMTHCILGREQYYSFEYDAAMESLNSAAKICKDNPNWSFFHDYASLYITKIELDSGRISEAEQRAKSLLARFENNRDLIHTLVTKELLTQCLARKYQYGRARAMLEEIIQTCDEATDTSTDLDFSLEKAKSLELLAKLNMYCRDYTSAHTHMEEAVVYYSKVARGEFHADQAKPCLFILKARSGEEMQQTELGEYLKLSDRILGNRGRKSQLNRLMGLGFLALGQFQDAIYYFHASVTCVYEGVLDNEHVLTLPPYVRRHIVKSLCNITGCYFQLGQFSEAERVIVNARKIAESMDKKDHPKPLRGCRKVYAAHALIRSFKDDMDVAMNDLFDLWSDISAEQANIVAMEEECGCNLYHIEEGFSNILQEVRELFCNQTDFFSLVAAIWIYHRKSSLADLQESPEESARKRRDIILRELFNYIEHKFGDIICEPQRYVKQNFMRFLSNEHRLEESSQISEQDVRALIAQMRFAVGNISIIKDYLSATGRTNLRSTDLEDEFYRTCVSRLRQWEGNHNRAFSEAKLLTILKCRVKKIRENAAELLIHDENGEKVSEQLVYLSEIEEKIGDKIVEGYEFEWRISDVRLPSGDIGTVSELRRLQA